MKTIFTLVFLLFAFNSSKAQIRYFKGVLQASQEGGSVSSPGSGVVIVKYNTATKLLEHFGNYRGLTANITNQHIHTGAPGVIGPVTIQLANTGGTIGALTGSAVLTAQQEADLFAGNMYTNVHTGNYPNGEIRAQLTGTTVGQTEHLTARLQGAQQVPPTNSLGTGVVNALVDKATHMLYLTGTYNGLTTPATNAHIHKGPPNVSGNVIVPLIYTTTTSGTLDTSRVITQVDEDSILSGNTYVNVHTSTFSGGEIRGQLTKMNQLVYFGGSLSGANEAPTPNASTAKGTVIVKYNTETNILELVGDYQNLNATISGSHIHGPAGPTATAGILFNLTNSGGTTGTLTGTANLTEAQEIDLLAGNMYVNVHSTGTYSGGEIRTQLIPTTSGETQYFTGLLQPTQSVATPAVVSSGSGSVTALLDKVTRKVYLTGSFSNLSSNITITHIHGGAAGTNGGVVVTLSPAGTTSGTITGSDVVRSSFADSMINGLTYVNIHTVNYGGGEIRAQLGDLVLPVKLNYFNGYKDRNAVALIWEAAQEINIKSYVIEQLNTQTGQWVTKTSVAATGSAKYKIDDVPSISNKDYLLYRLKMVDADGRYTYSAIIRINYLQSKAAITIMSNPISNGQLRFTITGTSTDQRAEISIMDMAGKVIMKRAGSSLQNNVIDISKLSPAIYRMLVKLNGEVLQESFSKQ